jgi:hypothetical protein
MRSALVRLSFLGLLLAGCGTHAPGPLPSGSSTEPIAGGDLDLEHSAVFQLFTRWAGEGIGACTATLVAPNLLVTARHCVSPGVRTQVVCGMAELGDPVGGAAVFATNDPVPGSTSTWYGGEEVRVQPDSNDTCGWDVALVILKESIPSRVAVPAIPRIDRPAERGEAYIAIGYGVNEDGQETEGRMLLGELEVRCSSDCDRRYVVSNEFMGETGVCSGDSGGPALDADGKLMGVVSRGSDPCSTPIYGSVAAWSDWIRETAFEAAALGGYPAPFWAWSGQSDLPPELVAAGGSCQSGGECQPGSACYFAADPALATCTQICENDAQCATGQSCQLGFEVRGGGLCLGPPSSDPGPDGPDPSEGDPAEDPGADPGGTGRGADDGCSVSGTPERRASGEAWIAFTALLFASGLTRRRGRARRT